MKPRFPARLFYGSMMQTQLMQMHMQRERLNAILDSEGYTGRRVLGYKLPVWQRKEKWTDDQCKLFIRSVWRGVGLSPYMVNMTERNKDADNVLLDGQQRLRAIERYWNGDFSIMGDDGVEYFWAELEPEEHAHFLRIPFPWLMTQYTKEQEMKDAYNYHNFGGTPHEPNERA